MHGCPKIQIKTWKKQIQKHWRSPLISGDNRVIVCPNIWSDTIRLSWVGTHGIVWAARAVTLASVRASGISAAITMALQRMGEATSIESDRGSARQGVS